MTSSNVLRTRKDVRYTSAIDPTTSDGLAIGELWQNVISGEIFTAIEGAPGLLGWRGTQGTYIPIAIPITDPSHPNLIAMYTMDNISGATLVDESPNSNDGTITGATAVSGHIGNALNFDAPTEKVVLSSSLLPNTTSFSVFTWVNTSDSSKNKAVVDTRKTGPISGAFLSVHSDGSVHGSLISGGDGIEKVSTTTVHNGVWRFIGMVVDRSLDLLSVYVDGTIEGAALDSSLIGSISTTQNFTIANKSDVGSGTSVSDFIGSIDQLRVFDIALTQPEIDDLYNAGVGA